MLRPIVSGSWIKILCIAVAGLLSTARATRAEMIISVQNVTALAGSSGNTLEVDLTNTGTAPVSIAGFSFELTVASGSGISFNGADIQTSQTYIFNGTSVLGPTISMSTGTKLDAGDVGDPPTSMQPSSTLGLGRVFFDVAGTAPAQAE
jgi:hypothetical protein